MNNNIYILNLNAKYLVGGKNFITDTKKLFSGSLPLNLDLIKLKELFPKEIKSNGKKTITKAFVNVNFTKAIYDFNEDKVNIINKRTGKIKNVNKKGKTLLNTKVIREKLYDEGFIVDGVKYIFYKRSSSKARNGSALFIKEKLFDIMMNWSRIGIKFEKGEKVAITSLKAYESLTLSAIEDIVTIHANEILLIDDVKGKFKSLASVTEINNDDELITTNKEIEISSTIWDGQSLADVRLFKDTTKASMLLRQRFFKSNAFSANIGKYFYDNHIEKVVDMFGKEMDASKILLITTPSSLKIFKLAYKIGNGTMKDAYNYWLDNLDTNFGICKHEKPSKYGNYQKYSYQMLNSMPFDKEDVLDLAQEELNYVELLKNNLTVFKNHINNYNVSSTREFIYNLLAVNSKVKFTQLFKDFKKNTIDIYLDELRKGRIKLPGTDYASICGNPYEMLECASGKKITSTLHKGKQIYCSAYDDSEQLICYRNPHVCSGNVISCQNVFFETFTTYFNFSDNIMIINSFDNDILERAQGGDMDGDVCLLSNLPLLVKRGLECIDYPTPINRIELDRKNKTVKEEEEDNIKKHYTSAGMASIDYIISKNMIGKIINLSQIFQSYFWNIKNNPEKYDKKLLDIIYNCISQLSSLSQVELDKPKKFTSLNMDIMLSKLKATKYNGEKIIKTDEILVYKGKITDDENKEIEVLKKEIKKSKNKDEIKILKSKISEIKKIEKTKDIRPKFFKYCGEGQEYKWEYFKTPMDYLEAAIDGIPDTNRTNTIDVNEILMIDEYDMNDADRKQIEKIKEIINKLNKNIKAIRANVQRDKKQDVLLIQDLKEEAIDRIKKMKISIVTILCIFNRIYSKNNRDKEISKYKILLLSTLWKTKKDVMINCFKKLADDDIEELQENKNGDIEVWGIKYNIAKIATENLPIFSTTYIS